jgi:hypothetical protein
MLKHELDEPNRNVLSIKREITVAATELQRCCVNVAGFSYIDQMPFLPTSNFYRA